MRQILKIVTVQVYNDNFDKALSKFKRKVKDAGIIDDFRKKEFYETESSKKQRLKKAARRRWLKKVESSLPKR